MGLLNDIKNQVKNSGSNKGKFLYFKSGTKIRVRFLDDLEDGHKIKFHDSFSLGVNVPCQETFDRECPHCENDELRTRDQYAWAVWDYDAKEVKILMAAVNQCSPVPGLVALYETYGTLKDRDFVITKSGSQQSTSYSVIPMDKAKFRNDKAKPFSESKFLQLLDKAFPDDATEDEDEDEDDKPVRKKKAPKDTGKKGRAKDDDDDDDEWDGDEDEEDIVDYYEMSAKELYKLCVERDIKVKPKKSEDWYIKLLEKADEAEDEDEDGDEWDE